MIKQRPYLANWSGNGIWYKLHSADAKEDSTIRFGVRVLLKRYDQDEFVQLVEMVLVPDANGDATVNWQSVLHAELSYALPDITSPDVITRTGVQTGQFYIEHNELSSDNETGWIDQEAEFIRYVIKGGVPDFLFNNNAFWQNYFPEKKPFLTWQMNKPLVMLKERIYLAWLHPYNLTGANFKLRVKIYYTDLSEDSKEISFNSVPMHITYLPAGAEMIGLQQVQPAKKIYTWTCQVVDVTGPLAAEPVEVSELFQFEADNRPDYNDITLLYRTSPGGLDTVRIRGVIETSLEYDLQEYTAVKQPPFNEGSVLSATRRFAPATEIPTYKGDVGHLKKEQQDRLRDLFLQRECYQVLLGKWVPYSIATKNLSLRKSTDKRWTLPIEFTLSTEGNAWYAPNIMGIGSNAEEVVPPGNNTCDCTITVNEFTKSFSADLCTVAWDLSLICPAGESVPAKIQYKIDGYTNWKDVAWPAATAPVTTHPKGVAQITVYWRAVCTSGEYGEAVPTVFDTKPEIIPVQPNSRFTNKTSGTLVVSLDINGIAVPGGIVASDQYINFYVEDGRKSISVTIDRSLILPMSLVSNGRTYLSSRQGKTYRFSNVDVVNGVQIKTTIF